MKIVFFDVDKITREYLQNKPIGCGEVILLEESLENISPTQYQQIKDAEVISVFVHTALRMNNESLDKFPALKLIATRSTGFDHIDLNYCQKRKIEVVNVPKYGESSVAEFAFGALLALVRRLIQARTDMKNNFVRMNEYIGFDLYNHTIGIIGTGAIGRHMAKLAKGFGMDILAYDLYPNEELSRILNLKYVSLDELYAKADVISLHIPATPQNYHLLDDKAFEKMKKGVIIVNTARGSLIDPEALYRALVRKQVAGAALDVLENEDFIIHDDIILKSQDIPIDFAMNTIVNARLMQMKNVLITPHIAFNSIDAVHRILKTTYENINAFCEGKIKNSVLKK
ncbi:NAD(P)-dependent oxidoreductase [Candidatus Avelusimicrobium sp.]